MASPDRRPKSADRVSKKFVSGKKYNNYTMEQQQPGESYAGSP